MPFLPEPRELEQRDFEEPAPPSRPRMSEDEADEREGEDQDDAETREAFEQQLRKVG